jgi:DNA polymerase-1
MTGPQEVIAVTTGEQVELLLRQVREQKVVTYDTETSGLDWKRNHIVGHVVKPIDCPSYYVPVRHAGGGNLPGCRVPTSADGWKGDLHPFEIELAKAVDDPSKRIIGHFLDFDLKMAYRAGILFPGPLEDTWINFSLLDENSRSFSLERAAEWCEVTLKAGVQMYEYLAQQFGCAPDRKSMEHFWRTNGSAPEVVEYAGGDGITTEEVWAKQQPLLDEDNALEFEQDDGTFKVVDRSLRKVWGVECRVIKTLFRMTLRGVDIDEAELDRVGDFFAKKAQDARGSLPDWFDNPNAPSQMKKLLAAYIEDPNWPRTAPSRTFPQGQLQFNERALSKVPEGRAVLDMREYTHAKNTFVDPMRETHLFHGKVHTSYNQMKKDDYGTVSGRLSSSDPNLTGVPKRNKKIGQPYRKIFLPKKGRRWRANDYKQQEYVVFTDYTREPTLVAGYCADPPIDIHQSVADMLGVERDPTAKRMNLGMLYGMGKDALAGHLQVPLEQAIAWRDDYHRKFPGSKDFLKGSEKVAKRRGFVFTYLGRRRRFPDARYAYKAGNAIIQGSSADITKLKLVEIDDYFESMGGVCDLLLTVHDSIDWDEEPGYEHVSEEALRIMQSFGENDLIQMGIPLRVDATEGANWSEATYG